MPLNRRRKLLILLFGILLAAASLAPPRPPPRAARRHCRPICARSWRSPGPHDGAYVYDVTAKQPLFSERATTLRPPASVEKLYTATAALALMGPTARLTTTVYGVGQLAARRRVGRQPLPARRRRPDVRHERLHPAPLRRGRDERLGARRPAGARRRHPPHHRPVEGDETFFDSLRGEPSSNYAPDPFLEGTLSGLAFNRGATGSRTGAHAPAAYAARALWAALKATA